MTVPKGESRPSSSVGTPAFEDGHPQEVTGGGRGLRPGHAASSTAPLLWALALAGSTFPRGVSLAQGESRAHSGSSHSEGEGWHIWVRLRSHHPQDLEASEQQQSSMQKGAVAAAY